MIQENLTISGAVREGAKRLKQCGIENADYDSYALLSEINGMDRTYYLMNGSKLLTRVEQERFFDYIERRSGHEPLQHILGRTFFYGHEFKVSPDVLIPRPDTEVLVEQVLKVCTDGMTVVYVYRFRLHSAVCCTGTKAFKGYRCGYFREGTCGCKG